MIQKLNCDKTIGKEVCKFCLFYEEDYMPTEMGSVQLEYCHNYNDKYCVSEKKQIMSFDIHNCDGFKPDVPYYLKNIEDKYDITILYAVPTGSRVYGYFNDNSDFDIHFIYKHNDIREYLHIDNSYEDYMLFVDGVYDIQGMDIKKTLYLYYKDNPMLYEYFNTPNAFVDKCSGVFKELPEINKDRLLHYYYNMAKNTWNKYCSNWKSMSDLDKLVKKSLIVSHCILSWNCIYNDVEPLLDFYQLMGRNKKYDLISEENVKPMSNLVFYNAGKGVDLGFSGGIGFKCNYQKLEEYVLERLMFMKRETVKYKYSNNKKDKKVYDGALYTLLCGGR